MLGLFVFAAACDDDDDDGDGTEPTATEEIDEEAAAAEAAAQAAFDAWNAGDVDTLLASFTDAGLLSTFGASREEAQQFLPVIIGDPPISGGTLTATVSGETATLEAPEFAFGIVLDPVTYTLVNQDGVWLIDNEEANEAQIPDGTTAVEVSLVEFAFNYDASAIADGNIAFAADNIGGAPHEIALVGLDEGVDLEASLQGIAEGTAEGIEVLGVGGPWEPGESANMVLTEELPSGRYAMVCFVEADDGTPHAFLGMTSEFTIE